MKIEDINKAIEILETNSLEEEAYFEFCFDDFIDYESIRANKEGLILYAKSLLKSIEQFHSRSNQKEEDLIGNYIEMQTDDWYVDNGFSLPYIIPVFKNRSEIKSPKAPKETLKSKIISWLIILLLLFIVASFTIGFIEILNWIFN